MRDLSRARALRSAADEAGVGLDIRGLDVTDGAAIDAVDTVHAVARGEALEWVGA